MAFVEYGFDASAFNRVLDGQFAPPDFVARVRDREARVILFDDSFAESLSWSPTGVTARTRCLVEISTELGHARLSIAVGLRRLGRREVRGGPLGGTPLLAEERVAKYFRVPDQAGLEGRFNRVIPRVDALQDKDGWASLHGELVDQSGRHEAIPDIPKFMSAFGARLDVDHHELGLLVEDREIRQRMLSSPARHRAHIMLAALCDLNRIAAYLSKAPQKDKGAFDWLKMHKGDTTDGRIAANAAYCTHFVTNDTGLQDRLEFLKSQGLCWFDTMTLPEFMSGTASRPIAATG